MKMRATLLDVLSGGDRAVPLRTADTPSTTSELVSAKFADVAGKIGVNFQHQAPHTGKNTSSRQWTPAATEPHREAAMFQGHRYSRK
jgi:hypothetical protein